MKLVQATQSASNRTMNVSEDNKKCWNWLRTAPFYETNQSLQDLKIKIATDNAIRVPVLKDVLFQGDQRYFTAALNLLEIPFHWRQVGLQVKLQSPDGKTYEHWPRTGSVGLEFSRDSEVIN